jgi:hypothetical protein
LAEKIRIYEKVEGPTPKKKILKILLYPESGSFVRGAPVRGYLGNSREDFQEARRGS